MKKLILMLLTAATIGLGLQAAPINSPVPSPMSASDGVSFRTTQKLRSSSGFEMYIYSNHSIEMFDDQGRSAGSGTWQLKGGELYVYSHSGNLIAKCECRVAQGELKWVKFNGDIYRKK